MKHQQSAINFAKEFINNFQEDKDNYDLSKDIEIVFSKDILEKDPDLKVLKTELNKINLDIQPTKKKFNWILKRL